MADVSLDSPKLRPSSGELKRLREAAFSDNGAALALARQRFPGDKDILKYTGIFQYRHRELAAAEETLTQASDADPSDAETALFLMRVHYTADALDRCEGTASALLRLVPHHRDALRTLGRIYNRRRSWADAASVWQRLADTAPEDAEALLQVARCFERLGRHEEAQAFAERTLAIDIANNEAMRIKVDAALAHGNHPAVIDAIPGYYRLEPARAIAIVHKLARSGAIDASATAAVTLRQAYPADVSISRLLTAFAEAWQVEAVRQELQGETSKAARHASALNILQCREQPDTVPPAVDMQAGPGAGAGVTAGATAENDVPAPPRPAGWLSRVWRWVAQSTRRDVPSYVATANSGASTRPSVQDLLAQAEALAESGEINALRELLPRLTESTKNDTAVTRAVGGLAATSESWPLVIEVWSRLRSEAPQEALLHLMRGYFHTGQHERAAELATEVLARSEVHPEAELIRARSTLASGAIDKAADATLAMVIRSPEEARLWFADQPESGAYLAQAVALSRAISLEPTRYDLESATRLFHIQCLGNAFACEIAGDFIGALSSFQAARVLRPDDQDAVDGIARVDEYTPKRPYTFRS